MRHPDTHQCAARHCQRQIPRKFLMCRPHWDLVPYGIQSAVYATWNDGEPTREYVSAVTNAIAAVAKASPKPTPPPAPGLFEDSEDGLVYPGDTPPDPIPAAPTPAPKQTLSPELATLCTQAATRLETLGLSNKEARRRLWDTIKDAVPSEPLGEADISRITPEVIAAAEADVRRHRESNTRAGQALAASEGEIKYTGRAHDKCRDCQAPIRWGQHNGKPRRYDLNGAEHWKNCTKNQGARK